MHPANIANVVAVNTRNKGLGVIKVIVFSNGGKLTCHYSGLGEVVSISAENINSFGANADGTEINFDPTMSLPHLTACPSNLGRIKGKQAPQKYVFSEPPGCRRTGF
jgi:hypothetical protein